MEGYLNKISRETRTQRFNNNNKKHTDRSRSHAKNGYTRKDRRSFKANIINY